MKNMKDQSGVAWPLVGHAMLYFLSSVRCSLNSDYLIPHLHQPILSIHSSSKSCFRYSFLSFDFLNLRAVRVLRGSILFVVFLPLPLQPSCFKIACAKDSVVPVPPISAVNVSGTRASSTALYASLIRLATSA